MPVSHSEFIPHMNDAIITDEQIINMTSTITNQKAAEQVVSSVQAMKQPKRQQHHAKQVQFDPDQVKSTIKQERVEAQNAPEQPVFIQDLTQEYVSAEDAARAQKVLAEKIARHQEKIQQQFLLEQHQQMQQPQVAEPQKINSHRLIGGDPKTTAMIVMGGCFLAGAVASWWLFGKSASTVASVAAPAAQLVDLAPEVKNEIIKSVLTEVMELMKP